MKTYSTIRRGFKVLTWAMLLVGFLPSAQAQNRSNDGGTVFKDVRLQNAIPGDGYMVAGDLWETIKPMNTDGALNNNGFGSVSPLFGSKKAIHVIRIGPDGVDWYNPGGHWPGGIQITDVWRSGRSLLIPVFEKDKWTAPLKPNAATTDDRFMFAHYAPTVLGANDATRNYRREARFTDATRSQLIYEAGWPTTAGIDIKLRARQFTNNEQNMNDFVVVEMSLTNTGLVDADANGAAEMTNHDIDALAVSSQYEIGTTVELSAAGRRLANRFGAGRTVAYAGVPESGNTTPMVTWFANVPNTATTGRTNPAAGKKLVGVNDAATLRGYTDIWNGQFFMGAKKGRIDDNNLTALTSASPDKTTLFGSHPVGAGNQKGWFTSWTNQLGNTWSFTRPELVFRSATATWYEDYGKTKDGVGFIAKPNPNYFTSGTADDVTTFVPKATPTRPNGDFKYASEDISKTAGINQPMLEDALNPNAKNGDFYNGFIGGNINHTFGESLNHGFGPFDLKVGESMTVYFVVAAGFRWEGVSDAAKAAEWAWSKGFDVKATLPTPPAPALTTESTPSGTMKVRWTDATKIDGTISGYKIWRASQYKREKYLDKGFRYLDNYQQAHTVGEKSDLDPVNPYFDAQADFKTSTQGWYQPEGWGPYELVAKIPLAEVSKYNDATGGYNFAYEDKDAITGFTYWYYVSSYKDGSFTGPRGTVKGGHVESSNFTRNGRNAPDALPGEVSLKTVWGGAYPWAPLQNTYPAAGTVARANLGAPATVTPPLPSLDKVKSLITVNPNPYKLTGLNDVRTNPDSHTIDFLNTPPDFVVTIMDVSGQIVQEAKVFGATNGKWSWDLFSKDGVEVASGLYIYHIRYGLGEEATGHFAIIR